MRLTQIFEAPPNLPTEDKILGTGDAQGPQGAQPGQPPMDGGMGAQQPPADPMMGGQQQMPADPMMSGDPDTDPNGDPILPDNGVDPEEVMSGLENHPYMDYEYPDEKFEPTTIASQDRGQLTQMLDEVKRTILKIEGEDKVGQYQNTELQFYKDCKDFITRVMDRLGDLTQDEGEEDDDNQEEFNPEKKRDRDNPEQLKRHEVKPDADLGESRTKIISRRRI